MYTYMYSYSSNTARRLRASGSARTEPAAVVDQLLSFIAVIHRGWSSRPVTSWGPGAVHHEHPRACSPLALVHRVGLFITWACDEQAAWAYSSLGLAHHVPRVLGFVMNSPRYS